MYKIIWNKEEIDDIKLKLIKDFDLVLTDDPNEVPKGKVGIILDEDNIEKIRPILELMALERSQILFQTSNGYAQLQVKDITYLEAYGDDIYLHGIEMTNPITNKGKKSTIFQKIIASEKSLKLSKLIAIKNDEINIGKDEKPASLIIRLFSFLNTKKSKSNDEIL